MGGKTGAESSSLRLAQAESRTRARYQNAPRGDRYYVANKLKFDPIGRVIDDVAGELGDVCDIGCGRGQLGLLLYELGKVRTLAGFDWDEHKVNVARAAAMGVGRYDQKDMSGASIPRSDTILIADVLHYLTFEQQDALLARAASALRPGGKLIMRDVDARRTFASFVTQACEGIGVRLAVNRGKALAFRSRAEQEKAIERAGLCVRDIVTTPGFFLDNVLIVARGQTTS